MTTQVKILGACWCPYSNRRASADAQVPEVCKAFCSENPNKCAVGEQKGAFQLSSDSDFAFQHVNCAGENPDAVCKMASGFPTFVVNDKVCFSGMGSEADIMTKLKECAAKQ